MKKPNLLHSANVKVFFFWLIVIVLPDFFLRRQTLVSSHFKFGVYLFGLLFSFSLWMGISLFLRARSQATRERSLGARIVQFWLPFLLWFSLFPFLAVMAHLLRALGGLEPTPSV